MNSYTVYAHKNIINQKFYIGITSQKPENRWGKNGQNYKLQPKFYNAILKYGWNNFEHLILYVNLCKEEACLKEQTLIKEYNSIENGYNIALGGGIITNKAVLCLTTGEIFNSVNEASKYAGVSPSTMSKYLRGLWDTCGQKEGIRLEWRFTNEKDSFIQKENNLKRKEKKEEQKENKFKESELYKQEYFLNNMTITEISKKYKVAKNTVSNRLKDIGVEVISSRESRKIQIEQYDKNWNYIQTFESITAALKSVGKTDSDTSRIKLACKEPWRIYKGFHWKLKDIEIKEIDALAF